VIIKKKSGKAGFVVVWEFQVCSAKRREFERVYCSDGVWAKLFRRGEGYIRTDLVRDLRTPGRYLTLDFWASREAYARFKKENRAEYQAIDERCASLTESEVRVGEFQMSASQKRSRP
jgi:heme-degrading monooxygenase HmoA